MEAPALDYEKLMTAAVANPEAAFESAFEADDLAALAIVSILAPGPTPPTKVANFNTFVSKRQGEALTTQLILGVIEQANHLPSELIETARTFLQSNGELPMDAGHVARAGSVVRNKSADDPVRGALLFWIWNRDQESAKEISRALLENADEPHRQPAKQALLVIGAQTDGESRSILWDYGKRHLEVPPQTPGHEPDAALGVVDSIYKPTDDDVPAMAELLLGTARQGIAVGDNLSRFYKRVSKGQVAAIAKLLSDGGHSAWLAEQFLPGLLHARGADFAPTAHEPWWSPECRAVFAATAWEQVDDKLYPIVLQKLHQTDDESASAQVRQRVAQRCQGSTSTESNAMPRIGIRALLKLALAGQVATDDPVLVETLQAVEPALVEMELKDASWKSPERAQRLGEIVAQLSGDILLNVCSTSLECKPKTTLALMSGAEPVLEGAMDALFEMVADNEPVLKGLCEISEAAQTKALARWTSEHSMVSFRALGQTSIAEERLAAVPAAISDYDRINQSEREELLAAYGSGDNRVELIALILGDRSKAGTKPNEQDLIHAINLLGEHLSNGFSPDAVLDTLGVICQESKSAKVRQAAYEALAKGHPTGDVVDLLEQREAGEASALRQTVETALHQIADKLDILAGDTTVSGRAEAAALLARIDIARAVVHARHLLSADEAESRILAAGIIGDGGSQADAEQLEIAISEEPSEDVRRAYGRAIRRLRIGDSAAAHERLGELAGVGEPDSWTSLEPNAVYGPWTDPVVKGLDRVARAESQGDFGTAIDQLDEVAKALLYRVIELVGEKAEVKAGNRAKAATNSLDYGSVLGWQTINQAWPWVHHFGSLHQLRTEHIARRGTVKVPPERSSDDLTIALSFFKLGAYPCIALIREAL